MQFKMKAMEIEQDDLQFLGTFDIFKESIKIILTWPKIFTQITLSFILPQSCLYLMYMLLISKNLYNYPILKVSSYRIMMFAYLILSTIFSLLISCTTSYTVASVYISKEITFKKVIAVIPKVWNRLVITYICRFCIMFASILSITLFIFISSMLLSKDGKLGIVTPVLIVLIMNASLMMCLAIIWQLSNVIPVMEMCCGFKALEKSKYLIKGKMKTAFTITLVMSLFSMPTLLSQKLADFGIVFKLCFGVFSLVFGTFLSLFSQVVETIFYLVCKSYHHESADKSCLVDYFGFYGGGYAPLKTSEAMKQDNLQVV